MDQRIIGSWHKEGISTLWGRPDPEMSPDVWKADRTAPTNRASFRSVGYVFRADGTGQIESRRNPPIRPPEPFTWRVESDEGHLYLVLSLSTCNDDNRFRLWIHTDGKKILWSVSPGDSKATCAMLLIRDDPAGL